MITVDGLTVEFGGTTLFKDISFQINEKDRIALMGKNGAGKSTLLKIIAGVRTATRGTVSAPKDCVIAYLPQHLMTEDGRTVFEETCQAFAHLHEIQAEIDRILWLIAHHHSYGSIDGPDAQILAEADMLVNQFEDGASDEQSKALYHRLYKTETGKRLFRELYFETYDPVKK